MFPVFILPIVWDMCERRHYVSVYFFFYTTSKNTLTENIHSGGQL